MTDNQERHSLDRCSSYPRLASAMPSLRCKTGIRAASAYAVYRVGSNMRVKRWYLSCDQPDLRTVGFLIALFQPSVRLRVA